MTEAQKGQIVAAAEQIERLRVEELRYSAQRDYDLAAGLAFGAQLLSDRAFRVARS